MCLAPHSLLKRLVDLLLGKGEAWWDSKQLSPLFSSHPQLQQGQFFQPQAGGVPSSQPRLTSPLLEL